MAQTKIQTNQLSDSGATPGSYTSADITVDASGRITAAANGSGGTAEPINQVVYGTGASVDSSSFFTYTVSSNTLAVNVALSSDTGAIDIRSSINLAGFGQSSLSLLSPGTSTASTVNLTSGNSTTSASSGDLNILGGGNTSSGQAGGVSVFGGSASSGTGGILQLHGGSSTSGLGGTTQLFGGDVSSGSQDGGSVFIRGGNMTGTGFGGLVSIIGGNVTDGFGGQIIIAAGQASGSGSDGDMVLQTGGVTRLGILPTGEWNVDGSTGSLGQVLTSNGSGSSPTWETSSGASEPANQIVYGTGSGVDSVAAFTYNPTSNAFVVNSAVVNDSGSSIELYAPSYTSGDIGGQVVITVPIATAGGVNAIGGEGVTFNGGGIFLKSGDSATFNGGLATLQSGDATAGTGNGGLLQVTSGASTGGTGGAILVTAGSGVAGGSVNINSGNADTGAAGSLQITAGSSTTGASASITLTAGYTATDSSSGSVQIKTGGVGTARLEIDSDGTFLVAGSAGTSGQVLTSAGTGAVPTWTTVTVSQPNMQIVYGTGSGVTSDAGLTYDSGTDTLTVASGTGGLISAETGQNMTIDADGGVILSSTGFDGVEVTSDGNALIGVQSLSTTATDGFIYIPTCAGPPTGTPTTITGMAPMVVDSTNSQLYVYVGGTWVAVN